MPCPSNHAAFLIESITTVILCLLIRATFTGSITFLDILQQECHSFNIGLELPILQALQLLKAPLPTKTITLALPRIILLPHIN